MPTVRIKRTGIDEAAAIAVLKARPRPAEAEIARHAVGDGDAWTGADLAQAAVKRPPHTPVQIRALRARLGFSQAQFAHHFGFNIDTLQQYEQGRRVPTGPAATLLRAIDAEPEAIMRALAPRTGNQPQSSRR